MIVMMMMMTVASVTYLTEITVSATNSEGM